jgi:Tfp pilus assembly protein PilF
LSKALEKERALQADPNYALAYAGLADAYPSLTSSDVAGLAPIQQASKAKSTVTMTPARKNWRR